MWDEWLSVAVPITISHCGRMSRLTLIQNIPSAFEYEHELVFIYKHNYCLSAVFTCFSAKKKRKKICPFRIKPSAFIIMFTGCDENPRIVEDK